MSLQVATTLHFRDLAGKKEFLDLVAGPLAVARAYDGCEDMHLRASTDDPLEVVIQSKWANRAAHDAYMDCDFGMSTGTLHTVINLLSKPVTTSRTVLID